MKEFTYFFTHLKNNSLLDVGDMVHPQQVIGIMGNTGSSTANHLHLGGAYGHIDILTHLNDFRNGNQVCDPQQLLYLLEDDGLFGIKPEITTGYADLEYFETWKKIHYGYDVVPEDRHKTREHFGIHWNRTRNGIVTAKGYDVHGYGHWIYIKTAA